MACPIRNLKIDVHCHILPHDWPDLKQVAMFFCIALYEWKFILLCGYVPSCLVYPEIWLWRIYTIGAPLRRKLYFCLLLS